MSYIPHTPEDIKQMLSVIGVKSIDELFKDIPLGLRPKSFNLPASKSEFQVTQTLHKLAAKNATGLVNFVGAGFYDHFIPAAVDALVGRSEFYTAYTPYQPECAQGWLQAIYEYQSIICELTGLDVSNASLYDGGTALFEAMMMALRHTGRNKIILDSGVNLIYRTMLYTYTLNLSIEFVEIPVVHGQSCREELFKYLDDQTAAVIFQNPNFFGAVDDYSDMVEQVHKFGALAIEVAYPVSLGMLKTPQEMGFDIAIGEGQSLGIPLSFGGPYLGFMAARSQLVRQMPGRIVGSTVDSDGKRGFVLTLQTREQHIRREKATSNICSNEALCALRAAVFISLLGREGFKELAEHNYQKAEFAKETLSRINGVQVKRSSPTFNEFTVLLPRRADEVVHRMIDKGFACGFPLGRFYKGLDNYLLIAVTEKRTKEEICRLADSLEAVL
ncbi:MAG: aminomethyl-transferring glycine dehydrogenase subunit GcvPA [Candidatus Omnitrophica bacterium]|nr:aminomethyl-transferring glycine dehydrogenase subunit GcvPA [Candidatus Omnitrophota bacterium]MBU4303833.1 aminomethyl-transferring glycine dehydrogenase subunit GcvPA [Candidatus Omnitrophota bacterium]MBU4468024.1 aminomethyl-transferring glycine dehydrogenase subunit GcvPA [Candidatus Omnitrophota bacterium]MCG2707821.1 aminomethyl-transferring glycine dehydrogenase subunit GcvPA [Candidatus Omnitrophota bacterium]